jgi:hypothetical protein
MFLVQRVIVVVPTSKRFATPLIDKISLDFTENNLRLKSTVYIYIFHNFILSFFVSVLNRFCYMVAWLRSKQCIQDIGHTKDIEKLFTERKNGFLA